MACAKHTLYTLHTTHNILDRRLAAKVGEIFSHKIRRRNQGEEQQQQQQPENRIKNATALNFRSARGKTQFRSHPKLEFFVFILCLVFSNRFVSLSTPFGVCRCVCECVCRNRFCIAIHTNTMKLCLSFRCRALDCASKCRTSDQRLCVQCACCVLQLLCHSGMPVLLYFFSILISFPFVRGIPFLFNSPVAVNESRHAHIHIV